MNVLLCILALTVPGATIGVDITVEKREGRGDVHEAVVRLDVPGELTTFRDPTGARTPLLLLDVPDSVLLLGGLKDVMETPEDFQAAFLRKPYGRRLVAKETRVPFRIERRPAADEFLYLNLITYTDGEKPEDARFVRRRYQLALKDGARAVEVDGAQTRWGFHRKLNIGDQAPDFDLPSKDGGRLRLADFRDKQNLVIVTYRAFW